MKMNKFLTSFLVLILVCTCFAACGFSFFKKKSDNNIKQQVVTDTNQINKSLWCITFQLVWNEIMDNITKGPVILEPETPEIAVELNKKLYTKEDLSPDSYYVTYGELSLKLKKQIEKEIYKKFKEKSDILDMIDWNQGNSYLFYSMLKKDFNFLTAFDVLEPSGFNGDTSKVKYFGIKEDSKKQLRDNIEVLFYNNENEYAVKLHTKENEDVILFRTEKNGSFEELYSVIQNNSQFESFSEIDTLKVPFIKVDKTISYDEICGKRIKDTNMLITQALQTIKFNMDNKGGTLKSEAAVTIMKTALMPKPEKPRHFNFDKRFILFLQESDKDKPYFAMVADDNSFLVKE